MKCPICKKTFTLQTQLDLHKEACSNQEVRKHSVSLECKTLKKFQKMPKIQKKERLIGTQRPVKVEKKQKMPVEVHKKQESLLNRHIFL